MKPFQQLKHEVSRKLAVPIDGNYANTQVRDFLQQRYRRIYDAYNWAKALDVITVTVSANTNYFSLAKKYESILAVVNTTQVNQVNHTDLISFALRNLSNSANANQVGIVELGDMGAFGVNVQNSTAQIVKVVSSSASDTSTLAIKVFVQGYVNGEITQETITLNGTTQVSGTLTWDANGLLKVTKVTVPTFGTITLYGSDGTTVLATIGRFETTPEYKRFRVSFTATTDTSLTAVVKKRFVPFLNNADTAIFDMDDTLISGATSDGWKEHRQYELAGTEEQVFQEALGTLVAREQTNSGMIETFLPQGRY